MDFRLQILAAGHETGPVIITEETISAATAGDAIEKARERANTLPRGAISLQLLDNDGRPNFSWLRDG